MPTTCCQSTPFSSNAFSEGRAIAVCVYKSLVNQSYFNYTVLFNKKNFLATSAIILNRYLKQPDTLSWIVNWYLKHTKDKFHFHDAGLKKKTCNTPFLTVFRDANQWQPCIRKMHRSSTFIKIELAAPFFLTAIAQGNVQLYM